MLIEDEDLDESETSMDELARDYRPPPGKALVFKVALVSPPKA